MEKGIVFNIQQFCVNDGPGIRTTVFLKGCPLRCAWCHNPESHKRAAEVSYLERKCIGCGECAEACAKNAHKFDGGEHTLDREVCVSCGECVDKCPTSAIEMMGKEMSVDDVISEVLRDKVFYESSGGGITLSGGEPLMQPDFAEAILAAAKKEGIHTAIETCGYADGSVIAGIAEQVDLFLYDIKLCDSAAHKEYTGVSNERIIENLRLIDSLGKPIILRCPIIPDVNDNEGHFCGIAALADSLINLLAIEIEPYHPLGNDKHLSLGHTDGGQLFRTPERDEVEHWIKQISKKTAITVRRG